MDIDTASSFAPIPGAASRPTADGKDRAGGDVFDVTISDGGVEVASPAPAQSAKAETESPRGELVLSAEESQAEPATDAGEAAATGAVYDIRGRMGSTPSSRPGQILDLTG